MTEQEKRSTGLIHKGDKLRQLLIENPDLPLLVFASDEANTGDYSFMSCTSIHAEVGEFLDCCQYVNDEMCFTDRDEFQEAVYDNIADDFDGTDDELEKEAERQAAEYNPYWKKCIILSVGN